MATQFAMQRNPEEVHHEATTAGLQDEQMEVSSRYLVVNYASILLLSHLFNTPTLPIGIPVGFSSSYPQ